MKKIVFTLLILISFTSCKTKKNTTTNNANAMLLTKVLDNYYDNSFKNKTVKASLKIKYKGDKKIPQVNASLRIEKDKVIWMSISKFITVGKLKITPNKVQFYNNIDQTYFDGDFSLLSNLLGTEVNFQQVQNILLGEAIYSLNKEEYQIQTEGNSYIFTPKQNDDRFNIFFWLDSQNFKAKKQEIRQNNGDKLLSIQFTEFEKVQKITFPKHLYILAKDSKKTSTINIDYKSIKLDLPLRYPFTIPEGYSEIQL